MSKAAERAITRAIEEGTAEIQAQLRAAQQRIGQLEGLLARIATIATQPTVCLPDAPKPIPREQLPPEIQAAMASPIEPSLEVAGSDNLGEGRWI